MEHKTYLGVNPNGFHRLAYVEWGGHFDKTVVCVHGLTRNSRDFDFLARVLSKDFRVVCPDVVGRGKSDWLPNPHGYGFPQYLSDLTALIARLNVPKVDWVGTSMGGLIGMVMAAQANTPIKRLIMNDVGPMIPLQGTKRIMHYVMQRPVFSSLAEAEAYLRTIFAPFGALSDEHWRHVTSHSVFLNSQGGYELAYDQNVLSGLMQHSSVWDQVTNSLKTTWHNVTHTQTPVVPLTEMWTYWEKVTCPVLLLRGNTSDVLLPETVARMQKIQPQLEVVEIKNVGHAPALMDPGQIKIVEDWLKRTESAA